MQPCSAGAPRSWWLCAMSWCSVGDWRQPWVSMFLPRAFQTATSTVPCAAERPDA